MDYFFRKTEPPKFLTNHLNVGGENPAGESIEVTSAYFTRGGKPWIPVMGEIHFQRCEKRRWGEILGKVKAGGVTLVSTYLFWIYHEEQEGQMDFTGDNNIREFLLECQKAGLDVIIRIGPWAHGECRNGGLPDWLLKKPYKLRENNPQYLQQVRRWYSAIAEQVKGLFYQDGGNIVGIQLENEYVDSAEHLAALKEIAKECGLLAPLYTVTGWNSAAGAKIPVDEVVPVFGGYCEAPWTNHTKQLSPSPHYFFNRMRNDSAIGADIIGDSSSKEENKEEKEDKKEKEEKWQLPYERYPFATCELGGGIQVTHHRRPIIKAMDIYAVSLIKLGDGNNLPGYYMYCGGTNKIGKLSTLQESKKTGYPNDYSILSYDFQTAVSEYGEIREQYRLLNLLHLFVQDYQEIFAPMIAVDAEKEVKPEDTVSLRYGMRTNADGKSGFVFVNHYQRLTPLADISDAVIHTDTVVFPPISVCGEVSFFLPFGISLGNQKLEYATMQPLCYMEDTYFFIEIPGIAPEYKFQDKEKIVPDMPHISNKEDTISVVSKNWLPNNRVAVGDIFIVTLTLEQAKYIRRLEGELYIAEGCDLYMEEGKLKAAQEGIYSYARWEKGEFVVDTIGQEYTEPTFTMEEIESLPFEIKPEYMEELQLESPRRLSYRKIVVKGNQGFISIEQPCDISQIYADGELIADNFYYGKPWRVPARLLEGKECYLVWSELKEDFYREF